MFGEELGSGDWLMELTEAFSSFKAITFSNYKHLKKKKSLQVFKAESNPWTPTFAPVGSRL